MKREYLVSRHRPDQFDKLSSPTRVAATLKAIRTKTERIGFSA